jgi:enoyl-[acyl-carrier protein] reductase I
LAAQAFHRAGASVAVGVQSERFVKRLEDLAMVHWGQKPDVVPVCDVASDESIRACFDDVLPTAFGGKLDVLVHSIAYAPADAMKGSLIDCSREGFRVAHDVSSYSLVGLTRAALPMLESAASDAALSDSAQGPSVLCMSYLGAQRAVGPYGVMGPAKASLEAVVRGLALDLGPRGIRVNALSPGTIQTLAARGIRGFSVSGAHPTRCGGCRVLKIDGLTLQDLHHASISGAPTRHVPVAADIGATAVSLASSACAGIQGQVVYVDGGVSAVAFPTAAER